MVQQVLIHGAGAVGAALGWRLAEQGAQVTVSCRSNYEAVRRRGFNVSTEFWGEGTFRPTSVVRGPSKPKDGSSYDVIIVATKQASHANSIIKELEHVVSPNTVLCSAQNGVTADHALAAAFPNNPIISAICYISLLQASQGVIIQDGSGLKPYAFAFGVHRGGEATEAMLASLVSNDDKFTYVASSTTNARWEKMIFNAAWNPACALFEMNTVEMQNSRLGTELVHALAEETYTVAASCGVTIDRAVLNGTKNWALNNPGYALVPSMLRDCQARKPMEVEALCGVLVNLAAAQGVHVPTIMAVERLLSARNAALQDQALFAKEAALRVDMKIDMMPEIEFAHTLKV